MLNRDDPLEFSVEVGTVEDRERDRAYEPDKEDPPGMHQATTAGTAQDPEVVMAAAIASLSRARKCLGQAREAIKKVPDAMMTELARGEATQEIVVACAWVEEARDCLKKPLDETYEYVDGKTWDGKFVPGINQDPTPRGQASRNWAFGGIALPPLDPIDEQQQEEDVSTSTWED